MNIHEMMKNMNTTNKITRNTFLDARSILLENKKLIENGTFKTIAEHLARRLYRNNQNLDLSIEQIMSKSLIYSYVSKEDVYQQFCAKELNLVKEPRAVFGTHKFSAEINLSIIISNLNECNRVIAEEEAKGEKNKNPYLIKKMKYLRKENIKYKDSNMKFLKEGIYELAIDESKGSQFGHNGYLSKILNNHKTPVGYGLRYSFDVSPFELEGLKVRFADSQIFNYEKIKELYENDREEFYKQLDGYINETDFIDELKNRIKSNYILSKRATILEKAIDLYVAKDYETFINIVVIQIEGLFHDYCSELEYDMTFSKKTLGEKVELIKEKERFFGYVYFKYDYPLLRNKVAHGILLNEEDHFNVSKDVILDLNYVLSLFDNKNLFRNILIDFIREDSSIDEIVFMLIYMLSKDKELFIAFVNEEYIDEIEFYGLKENYMSIIEKIATEEVWDTLYTCLEYGHTNQLDTIFGLFNDVKTQNKKEFRNLIRSISGICIRNERYRELCISFNKRLNDISYVEENFVENNDLCWTIDSSEETVKHKSESSTQLKAEKVMLNMLEEKFGLDSGDLSSEKIKLSDKVSVEIDGYNEEHGIMIEVFARMTPPKPAHYEKIANDILKLIMVEKHHNREYRKVLAVCGDEVEKYLLGKSWKAHAVNMYNFEVIKIDIPLELKEEILAAQGGQNEGNKL